MTHIRFYKTRAPYRIDEQEEPFLGYIDDEAKVLYNSDINDLPLYIEALEDLQVSFSRNTIEYSIDNYTWTSLAKDIKTPTIPKGTKVFFRANNLNISTYGIGTFKISGKCNLGGNIMSMHAYDYNIYDYYVRDREFRELFKGQSTIFSIDKLRLPATNLGVQCYEEMFSGCTNLHGNIKLPATILKSRCYYCMFEGTNSIPDCSNIDFTSKSVVQSGGLMGLFTGTKVTDNDLLNILPIDENGDCCLPVLELWANNYSYMFKDCKNITKSPKLKATSLSDSCYYFMFAGSNALPDISNIDLTNEQTVATGALSGLFAGTKITDDYLKTVLPINEKGKYYLPVTNLTPGCYELMFYDCDNLLTAPELPATTLIDKCYYGMFWNCDNLITAPELPAVNLVTDCYSRMFLGCEKLTCIRASFVTTPSTAYTDSWVSGIAGSGKFIKNPDATWDLRGQHGIPASWEVEYDITPTECKSLSITADDVIGNRESTTIHWTAIVDGINNVNGESISDFTLTGITESAIFGQNTSETETITREVSFTYMGVTATTTITQDVFVTEMYIEAIDDLTAGFYSSGQVAYYSLDRQNWIELQSSEETPIIPAGNKVYFRATEASTGSYGTYHFFTTGRHNVGGNVMSMIYGEEYDNKFEIDRKFALAYLFRENDNLISAEKLILPALSVSANCYESMFYLCRKLVKAPAKLPATKLSNYCYSGMFEGCSSLVTAPELPSIALSTGCYNRMFALCISLVDAPALPSTDLKFNCYKEMFEGSALTTAPELPSLELYDSCYKNMFKNCHGLTYIKAMFTTTPSSTYTENWVSGVASTGTFVKNSNATWNVVGTNGVPKGWTVEYADA